MNNIEDILIEFEIINPKLISINEQYLHPIRKTKTGRYTSYYCPSPELKELQAFYKEVLVEKIPEDILSKVQEIISKEIGLSLEIIIGMPSEDLLSGDVSNFIKALEDCIVQRTKIDDKYNYRVTAEKRLYCSENNNWILKVKIKPYHIKGYYNYN